MRSPPMLPAMLCLLAAAAVAAERVGVSSQTHDMESDRYSGDWGRATAMMYNGIFPDDLRKFFDRDPERAVPSEPNIVVAPADGIILAIKDEGGAKTLIITLSMQDVHVQRIPISGKIRSMETVGHERFPFVDPRSMGNVRVVTAIDTAIGPFIIKQITGIWTSRIQNYIKVGQKVRLGERMGRILLGSTVVLTAPKTVRFTVKQYDRVFGGQTIIGRY